MSPFDVPLVGPAPPSVVVVEDGVLVGGVDDGEIDGPDEVPKLLELGKVAPTGKMVR